MIKIRTPLDMGPEPNRLRALVLTPDFPPLPGGIQLLMHRLARDMSELDARFVTLGAGETIELDAELGAEIVRVASKGGRVHKLAIARLNAAGVRNGFGYRPQVVISGHVVTSPAAALLKAGRRVPVLQYLYGDELRTRPRLAGFAVRRADAVIAISEHTRQMALACGCDPARLKLVHPGVDPPSTQPIVRADRPTVLTVARLHDSYKGHDRLIEALPLIRARVPDLECVVIGDGRLRPSLESLAAEHDVSDSIRFLGRVPDSERDTWLSRAHVFAMPSRLPTGKAGGEGFGIVYLEAGAHKLPVVAGNVGGAVDAVVNGETGLLVDPNDPKAIGEAVTELLLDPARAAALGEAGAVRARELTWERHTRAVQRLVNELGRGSDDG
jgi:phosphatidyl-myo-inositol dimannoside synthase